MTTKNHKTEELILIAAKKVFIKSGMEGARMQEISNEAGINKALLHYYFRTKQKLFEAVFNKVFNKFLPKLDNILESEKTLEEKIELFVEQYINLIINNPHIPSFVLHELNRHPERLGQLIKGKISKIPLFIQSIEKEIEKGKIKPIDPKHLIVNIIALCIFPFVARPILLEVLFDKNKHEYKEFLKQRKTEVSRFILDSIRSTE